jgi:subtilisin family serine protease
VDGAGLTAAVIDGGVRTTHSEFEGRALPGKNFTLPDAPFTNDDVKDTKGHGTMVAGLIASKDKGVAPKAKVVPLKVLRGGNRDTYDATLDALNWVLKNHKDMSITVVNVSMSDPYNHATESDATGQNPKKKAIADAIRALREQDVAVVAAAGNAHHKYNDKEYMQPATQGMSFPAIVPATVSVGAVFDADGDPDPNPMVYEHGAWTKKYKQDRVCPFSQRLHPDPARTDVFAPGADMTSTGNKTDEGVAEVPSSGTSAAAPMVAGTILLMQQYHIRVTNRRPKVGDIERWLREGGVACKDEATPDDSVAHTDLAFTRLCALGALSRMANELKEQQSGAAVAPKTGGGIPPK